MNINLFFKLNLIILSLFLSLSSIQVSAQCCVPDANGNYIPNFGYTNLNGTLGGTTYLNPKNVVFGNQTTLYIGEWPLCGFQLPAQCTFKIKNINTGFFKTVIGTYVSSSIPNSGLNGYTFIMPTDKTKQLGCQLEISTTFTMINLLYDAGNLPCTLTQTLSGLFRSCYIAEPDPRHNITYKLIQNSDTKEGMSLYVNQVSNLLTLNLDLKHDEQISLFIYDIHGIQVLNPLNSKKLHSAGKVVEQYNIENFAPGIYLYRLMIGNDLIDGKFVKE